MCALARGLQVNYSVTSLCLSDCWIGKEGMRALAELLKAGSPITSLNLTQNNLAGTGEIIVDMISRSQHLTSLCLSHNHLRDSDFVKIARALPSSHLTSLDVSHNDIGERGGLELAKAINDTALQSVSLGWNHLLSSAKDLVAALMNNSLLSKLSLEQNSLSSKVAIDIATMINTQRPPLTYLNLAGTGIDPVGLKAIFDALANNRLLSELNISGCLFASPEVVQAFLDRVPQSALKCLELRGCIISEDGHRAVISLQHSGGRTALVLGDDVF